MKKIACILKGYPRLSETFIARELHALEEAGVDIVIYSLRYPTDHSMHPVHGEIRARIRYLPEYIYQQPFRVLRAFVGCLFNRRLFSLFGIFIKDFIRDPTPNRARRLFQAVVLAREIEPDREWIYAHFIHTPGSVARYCSHISGIPWSCSAHARDIWTIPAWELREKISSLEWLVTCTLANLEYLRSIADQKNKITLVYHGIDLDKFQNPAYTPGEVIEGSNRDTLNILSVGRAVEKKGYDILIKALATLPSDLNWRFIHIGDGQLLADLKAKAKGLGIDGRIEWRGQASFDMVLDSYRNSNLFVLASRVDRDGDRDGLPNVLMEAMALKVPCISTDLSGIPELIDDGVNGVLVPPEDAEALGDAILHLLRSSKLRRELGQKGYETVTNRFSMDTGINLLLERFS